MKHNAVVGGRDVQRLSRGLLVSVFWVSRSIDGCEENQYSFDFSDKSVFKVSFGMLRCKLLRTCLFKCTCSIVWTVCLR